MDTSVGLATLTNIVSRSPTTIRTVRAVPGFRLAVTSAPFDSLGGALDFSGAGALEVFSDVAVVEFAPGGPNRFRRGCAITVIAIETAISAINTIISRLAAIV